MAKELGVSKITISKGKRSLREQDRLTGDEKPETKTEKEMKRRIKETEKMIKDRKTSRQMAEELGVSRTTIIDYKNRLVDENRIIGYENLNTAQKIKQEQRIEKLREIEKKQRRNKKRKTREEIGKKIGVNKNRISIYRNILKVEEVYEWNEKIQRLYENFEGQNELIEQFEEYLTFCKKKYEEKLISKEHLLSIKYAAIATDRYANVAFYIKLCIRFNQFEEAIKFAHDYVNCETFTQEEKEKIKKSKEECQRYFKAINMIKQNINDEQIMEISGVSKVELAI